MLIAGVLITNKAHLLVCNQELTLFLQTYVTTNIEHADPSTLDLTFIAAHLQKDLELAFGHKFSVKGVDASTGDPIDDLTHMVALEVSTPFDVPSLRIH